jgi:hypothetical protein
MMRRDLSLTRQVFGKGEQAEGGFAFLEHRDKNSICDERAPILSSDFMWDTGPAEYASCRVAE